jgi:hypothetical protein
MRRIVIALFASLAVGLSAQTIPAGFENAQRYTEIETVTVQVDQLKPESAALKERKIAQVKAGCKRQYMEAYKQSNRLLY